MTCALELLLDKAEARAFSKSELAFFDNIRSFKKNYMKWLLKKSCNAKAFSPSHQTHRVPLGLVRVREGPESQHLRAGADAHEVGRGGGSSFFTPQPSQSVPRAASFMPWIG